MSKVTITPINNAASPSGTANINNNFNKIAEALENTLSRDGTLPNQVSADIDLNGNDLLNVNIIDAEDINIDGVNLSNRLQEVVDARDIALNAATVSVNSADEASSSAASSLASSQSSAVSAATSLEAATRALENATQLVISSQSEAEVGTINDKGMTPLRTTQHFDIRWTAIRDKLNAIPITAYSSTVGTGGDDGATLNTAIADAFSKGRNIDLCGLDILTSIPIVLRTGLVSTNGSANGSEIKALAGFSGTTLINLWHPTDPYRSSQVVSGIRFNTNGNNIKAIGTTSTFGGGGKIGVSWVNCQFTSTSTSEYAVYARTVGGSEQGAFTGHHFIDCVWFAPLPYYFGENQDDITLTSPRVTLTGSSSISLTPMVLHGNNIVRDGTSFEDLDNGPNYTSNILHSIGNGIVQIGVGFIEDTKPAGHNFAALFACNQPRANFTLAPQRLNLLYTGSGASSLVRYNLASTDTAEKLISVDKPSSYGGPGSALPASVFAAFVGSNLSTGTPVDPNITTIVADLFFTLGNEWNSVPLISSVSGSTASQGYRSRLHGWVGGKRVERAYQIASGGGTPVRRDLELIPEQTAFTIAVNQLISPRPGYVPLTNTSGATREVSLGSWNAIEEIKDGARWRIVNLAGSTNIINVRSASMGGATIVFPASATVRALNPGDSLSLEWKNDKFIEVVDPT